MTKIRITKCSTNENYSDKIDQEFDLVGENNFRYFLGGDLKPLKSDCYYIFDDFDNPIINKTERRRSHYKYIDNVKQMKQTAVDLKNIVNNVKILATDNDFEQPPNFDKIVKTIDYLVDIANIALLKQQKI